MSRTDRTLTPAGPAPSVIERLAELYADDKGHKKLSDRRPRRRRRDRRNSVYGAPRKAGPSRAVVALVVLAVFCAGLAFAAVQVDWIKVQVTGVEDGEIIRGDQLPRLELRVRASGRGAGDVSVMLNGAEIPTSVDEEGVVVASLAEATNGPNLVAYRVRSELPMVADETGQLNFTVRFGPVISVPRAVPPPTDNKPAVIRGLVSDDVLVEVNGKPATRESGAFTAKVAKGARDATVIATAPDGSITKAVVKFEDTVVTGPRLQAYHVSSPVWNDPQVQADLERLAKEGKINAVELSIKDEAGMVGYDTKVPLAKAAGAIARDYDLQKALDRIHSLGLIAIGRVVCFRDPKLAQWGWNNGKKSMVIQDETGQPLDTKYGSITFTNVGNPEVRQYNIDLAIEAANAGFDHIMLDYVRRPEGDLEKMKFPGSDYSPQVQVAYFVRDIRTNLPPQTKLGLAVFGIAATRPIMIAQDLRLLAPLADYIAPMVYPSHWGPGEYKVENPNAEPAKIVERSTRDFVRIASAGGAYTVSWLQDFSIPGYPYGTAEVATQIEAAEKAGSSGYLLWNPNVRYHFDVLEPMPEMLNRNASTAPTTSSPTVTSVA